MDIRSPQKKTRKEDMSIVVIESFRHGSGM